MGVTHKSSCCCSSAGHVPSSNRKDIRNAVEAMNKASNWSTSSGHLRAQIIILWPKIFTQKKNFQAHRSNVW